MDILKTYHDDQLLGGHLSKNKALIKIKRLYFWPNLSSDVGDWIKGCTVCQQKKSKRNEIFAIPVSLPWEIIGVDIIGPLPTTTRGNRYIFTFVDHFTKYAEAFPTQSQDEEIAATLLIDNIKTRYSAPKCLLSDRGQAFEN